MGAAEVGGNGEAIEILGGGGGGGGLEGKKMERGGAFPQVVPVLTTLDSSLRLPCLSVSLLSS